MNREQLISRKHEVIAERQRLQRELAGIRQSNKPNRSRISQLESRIQQLQSQEYQLRLAIDRSKK